VHPPDLDDVFFTLTAVLLLLLFVGVFGGVLGAGLGGASHGGTYVDYVVPGFATPAADRWHHRLGSFPGPAA
jgi:hypothetical protein